MSTYPEKQSDKQDAAEVKNYTRTPNMLIFGYRNISPQEKWLYTCLKHLCGRTGTRHLSLRYISDQTGISTGALSLSKDKSGKVNEGMIRHLHDAGLIHSEIKKHNGKGNPQYHITITDVWGLNQDFFATCSSFGQDEENVSEFRTDSSVTCPNSEQACPKDEQGRPNSEQACPNSSTILRLESKTTNKTTLQDESSAASADTTPRTPEKLEAVSPLVNPKTRMKPARKPDIFESAAPEVQAVITEWRAIFKTPPPITPKLIEQAISAAAYQPTPGELAGCRLWMYQTDTKKWYSQHGMNLGTVVGQLEKYRSLADVPEVEDKNFVNGQKRKIYSSFDDPTFDAEQSMREDFYPVKPIVTRQEAEYAASF